MVEALPDGFVTFVDGMLPASSDQAWKSGLSAQLAQTRTLFLAALVSRETHGSVVGGDRFGLAIALFFKILESIIELEVEPRPRHAGLLRLLQSTPFIVSLMVRLVVIALFVHPVHTSTRPFGCLLQQCVVPDVAQCDSVDAKDDQH